MRLLPVLIAATSLAACSATGNGTGVVTSAIGAPAGRAAVTFVTDGGAVAQLQVKMPDGETFHGPAVSGAREPMPGFAFAPGRRSDLLITAPGREWTAEVTAALRSPHGRTMECRLREKRVGLGLEGGAIGFCTASDGRHVQIDI